MYNTVRKVHLALGLFFMLFLLMYGVSAVQMAHPSWFDLKPTVTEQQVQVRVEAGQGVRGVARHLMEAYGFRGELAQVRETEEGYAFRIVRPGTVYEVDYTPGAETAHVRTHVAGVMGMLNRIHHLGGLWHEYVLLDVWGLFVGLTSVGVILLGLSGVYMWFRSHRKRRTAGAVLLAISLGLTLSLMISMRLA